MFKQVKLFCFNFGLETEDKTNYAEMSMLNISLAWGHVNPRSVYVV